MRSALIALVLVVCSQAYAAESILFGSDPDALTCYQGATVHPQSADPDTCTAAIKDGRLSNSDLAATYSNRGIILANQGRLAEAIQDQLMAVKLDPLSPRVHNNIANAYYRAKQHDKALDEYSKAISLSGGKLAPAYFNRGLLHIKLGDRDAARKDLAQAATLAPDAYQNALDGFDHPAAGAAPQQPNNGAAGSAKSGQPDPAG